MKTLFITLAILLYFNSTALASWSTQDLVLESVYLGLLYVDCEQTRTGIIRQGRHELNPLLHHIPTETQIRDACLSVMFSQIAVVTLFPRWRTEVIVWSIVFEASTVTWNAQF